MSQGTYCIVKNCGNSKKRNANVAFFNIPKNAEAAKKWVEFAERDDLLVENLSMKSYRVCSDYFLPNQLKCTAPRKLLLPNAYP
jgi:hypothetical protein